MIFIYTLIFSQLIFTWAVDISWKNSFYVNPLKTKKDCKSFFASWNYKFARCDIYTDETKKKLYLDPQSMRSLKVCLDSATDAQDKKLLITDFRRVQSVSPLLGANYSSLQEAKESSVHLIPLFRVLLGPGGTENEIFEKPPDSFRHTLIVLAPSEEENITAKYPDNFEKLLDKKALKFFMFRDNSRMIQFNAWHLMNMDKVLTWHGLKYFAGIILYATPKHAQLLSIRELKSRIPTDYHDRVHLDIYQIQDPDSVVYNKMNNTQSSSSPGTLQPLFIIINLLTTVIVIL